MNSSQYDIEIQIHLCDPEGLNSKQLLQALDTIETSLFASDRQDVERAAKKLEVPAITRDACLERLRGYRNDRLLLTGANNGSIELIAVVAGVSYFVLQKTIGETFKEGYKETEVHRKLKEFFRESIDEKALFISESLRRVFANKKKLADVKLIPAEIDSPNRIVIDIQGRLKKDKEKIYSLGEQLHGFLIKNLPSSA